MFDVGMNEMIVILVIALIVIGPKQLPEIARMLGKGMAVLRKARNELTDELRESIDLERHVSQFRSDMEKYIEDEPSSMKESADERISEHTARPGHTPDQQEQEARKTEGQEAHEKGSTLAEEEPVDAPDTTRSATEKAGPAEEGMESGRGENPTEGSHG
jgi:Tat protein translocase TatB subunit